MKGIYTALVTPFSSRGRGIDRDLFRRLMDRQVKAGVSGVVLAGSTGEGQTLHSEEWDELLELGSLYRRETDIMMNCSSSATWEVQEKLEKAEQGGASSVLVSCPPYNKPMPEGLEQHFLSLQSSLPIMIYNIPGRAAVNLSARSLSKIWKHSAVRALKESSGNMSQFLEMQRTCPKGKVIFSGDDPLNLAFWIHGAQGSVSVVSNLFPEKLVRLWKMAQRQDWEAARKLFFQLLPLTEALFVESNPIPVKYALGRLIKKDLRPRLPLSRLQAEHTKALDRLLRSF